MLTCKTTNKSNICFICGKYGRSTKNTGGVIFNTESKNEVCLDIRNVTFSYRGADVLKDVNLTLTGGFVIGVVGTNGVGKTTLLSILVDDLIPNKRHRPDQRDAAVGVGALIAT